MDFPVPGPSSALARILNVRSRLDESEGPISEWRAHYSQELAKNRRQPDIAIFTGL